MVVAFFVGWNAAQLRWLDKISDILDTLNWATKTYGELSSDERSFVRGIEDYRPFAGLRGGLSMEKILYLCFACAAAMADGFEVEELPGQLKNARCEKCARKAWGATYRIKAKNNRGTTDQSRATVK